MWKIFFYRGVLMTSFLLNAYFQSAISSLAGEEASAIIQTYKQAILADPKDVIAHFNLGLAYYKGEQYNEARDALEKCLNLSLEKSEAHKQVDGPANQLLGIIYYSYSKDDRKAIQAFRESLKLLPNDPDTFFAMGLADLRLKDYQGAIQAFNKSVEAGRIKDPEVYFHLGRAQSELGWEKEAEKNYEKVLEVKPDYIPALEILGLTYHKQKQVDKTIQVLEKLIKIDPANFNANYLLGLNYYQKKMYPEMVAAYNRAVSLKPDLADVYYNLGMAYYYQTRFDLSIETLKKAVSLNPKDAEAYNLLGQAQTAAVEMHLQQGSLLIAQEQYSQAIGEFRKVLEYDTENRKAIMLKEDTERKLADELAAHLQLGEKFYREAKLEEAYKEYQSALRLDKESEKAQAGIQVTRGKISKLLTLEMSLGKVAERAQNYRSAKEHYEAGLQIKPNSVEVKLAMANLQNVIEERMKVLNNKAKNRIEKGELIAAADEYKEIRKLAKLFEQKNWEEKALNNLTRVNAQKADMIAKYTEEGKNAFKSRAVIEAKKAFNRVLALDPQNKIANEYILKLTGSQSQAKVTDEKVKEMYYKGVDYYVKGQIDQAIKAWQEVLELDPNNQDAAINIDRAKAKLQAIQRITEGK